MAACDPKYATSRPVKPEDIERECLSDLKRIIKLKFSNVRHDMDDYWNKDYKSFVLELIKRSNLATPLRSPSNNGDEPVPATDQTASRSEPGETESKAVSQSSVADTAGGAQVHVEDKYKCCRFCTKWRGVTGDEFAICRVFKEQRDAASGRDCKYYKPDWGQMTIEMM